MSFAWPDPISLLADAVTIIGIPLLAWGTRNLYHEFKEARQPKGVGEDCLMFFDSNAKFIVNNVPYKDFQAVPRVGDLLDLPGTTDGDRSFGTGKYLVMSVEFYYREDRISGRQASAMPTGIHVEVKKLRDLSA